MKKNFVVTFLNSENIPEAQRANTVLIADDFITMYSEFDEPKTFPAEYLQSITREA